MDQYAPRVTAVLRGKQLDLPMPIRTVVAGTYHMLALSIDSRIYGWSENGHGQLGDGTTVHRIVPVVVPGFDQGPAIASVED